MGLVDAPLPAGMREVPIATIAMSQDTRARPWAPPTIVQRAAPVFLSLPAGKREVPIATNAVRQDSRARPWAPLPIVPRAAPVAN